MPLVKATPDDLEQCADVLFVPEVGQLYFPKKELLRSELESSMNRDEVYVDRADEDGTVQGVIWFQHEGLFHAFPYLHMIAVRGDCRHLGVGSRLMDFYEQSSLHAGKNKLRTKVFLLVSDFNKTAQQFYLSRGYQEVGQLESLFRKGITEILLMKKVTALKK